MVINMKNIKAILSTSLICVLCVIVGFFIGHFSDYNKATEETATTDNSTRSSQIVVNSNNEAENQIQLDENNEYPFELYHSFLVNSSNNVIDILNSNPIDEVCYEKYINSKSSAEEQEALSSWINAYKNEFENAKSIFENSIDKKSIDNNTSQEDIINVKKEYIACCSSYAEATAQLAYEFEEFNLGNGTNHNYALLLNLLEINRTNTLHLIECIYMLDNSYTWLYQ